jgi:hypothetical protein
VPEPPLPSRATLLSEGACSTNQSVTRPIAIVAKFTGSRLSLRFPRTCWNGSGSETTGRGRENCKDGELGGGGGGDGPSKDYENVRDRRRRRVRSTPLSPKVSWPIAHEPSFHTPRARRSCSSYPRARPHACVTEHVVPAQVRVPIGWDHHRVRWAGPYAPQALSGRWNAFCNETVRAPAPPVDLSRSP